MGQKHSHKDSSHSPSRELEAERQKYGITKDELKNRLDYSNLSTKIKSDEDVIDLARKLRSDVETGLDAECNTVESLNLRRKIFGSGSLDFQLKLKDKSVIDWVNETVESLRASKIHVIRHGGDIELSVEDIVVGDIVVIEPGAKITPADGVLVKGKLLVNEANLTGDPDAAKLSRTNRRILGGMPIVSGGCTMLVLAVGKEATWALSIPM